VFKTPAAVDYFLGSVLVFKGEPFADLKVTIDALAPVSTRALTIFIFLAAGSPFGIGVGGRAAIGAAVAVRFAVVGTSLLFGCGLFGLFAVARLAFLAGDIVGFFGLKAFTSLGPLGLLFLGFPLEKVELGVLLLVLRLAVRVLGFGSVLFLPIVLSMPPLRRTLQVLVVLWVGF
jgi:hypothetical protein